MFKDKKVIIFDMDGTLIDSMGIWNEVDIVLIKQLGYKGELQSNVIQKERGHSLRKNSKAEKPYLEYCKFLKNKYNLSLDENEILKLRYEISQKYLKNIIDYKPDADKFIKKLKEKGFILGIASATQKVNMDIYRTQNSNLMDKANIDEYFSFVFTKEDAKEIKPNPEIYLRIVKDLNLKKEECLIFEDSLIGIEAAKNAAIQSVAVYDQYSDSEREEINKISDYHILSYSEAIDILYKE